MSEDQLEALILQTINGAVATIPNYLEEIKANKDCTQSRKSTRICVRNSNGNGIRYEWSYP